MTRNIFIPFFCALFTFAPIWSQSVPEVLVSIPPYKFLVESIAKDTVKVRSIVPPTESAHFYSPTPKEMTQVSQSDIWFTIGEAFEGKVLPAIQSHNQHLKVVDLQDKVNLIDTHQHKGKSHGCHHCIGGVDLHFWLSPLQAKIQAKTIAEALIKQYPEHSLTYEKNLAALNENLDDLHETIKEILTSTKKKIALVSHHAFAYFARDYGFEISSIEFEGKSPSSLELTQILKFAKDHEIDRIYILKQFQNRGAIEVAKQINAELVMIDPYSEKYLVNMRDIALRFSGK